MTNYVLILQPNVQFGLIMMAHQHYRKHVNSKLLRLSRKLLQLVLLVLQRFRLLLCHKLVSQTTIALL